MLKVFVALVLIIASFFGGLYYERHYSADEESLKGQIAELEQESARLSAHNAELSETLALVKRQIQTDRMAYESLQEIVDASEEERTALREQIESQRELLTRLRERLESQE